MQCTIMHFLPDVTPQPQLILEVHHLLRDGGGQAVQVREQHCAGAQGRQHRCERGNCSPCYEDLTAEERTFYLIEGRVFACVILKMMIEGLDLDF